MFRQCEDHLFPRLSLTIRERGLYYHLLRHTHVDGKAKALFALSPLAHALSVSDTSVREDIRSLNEKGCIRIEDRSRQGHFVEVLLPENIPGVIPEAETVPTLNLEELDFFSGRRYMQALLHREGNRCFYCLKNVCIDSCELDHAISRVNGTDHSYRNIVVSCHDCNTTKLAAAPADFLRTLYRKGRLSTAEFEERLGALELLQSGKLVPDASLVAAAIM